MKAESPTVTYVPMFIEALQWPKGGNNPSAHHWMDGQAKRDADIQWNIIRPKKEANSDTCCNTAEPGGRSAR